jgi:hypothetical protein
LLLGCSIRVMAADLAAIDRSIKKEPVYASKSPRHVLLVLGLEAKDRVWLVKDGDVLYVDRNGNGDLTEPAKAVAGITEYWIVDPQEQRITVLTLDGQAYRLHGVFVPGERATSVLLPGLEVDVAAAFKAGQVAP